MFFEEKKNTLFLLNILASTAKALTLPMFIYKYFCYNARNCCSFFFKFAVSYFREIREGKIAIKSFNPVTIAYW